MPAWGADQAQRDNIAYQQQRYENQQGPMVDAFAYNYGRGTESDYGNYTDIMNNYRDIYSGGGAGGGATGGGGGGGSYSAGGSYDPFTINYNDPFNSYAGYQGFSQHGGYTGGDIAALRERGVSPVRAAYANAQRNVQQQRSLQGGYSPNAVAAQVKMAREQGQLGSDAISNVNAGIVADRNKGQLAGLGGMAGIETSRLGADLDVQKFNAQARAQAQAAANAGSQANADRAAAAGAASMNDRFRALGGASQLYGTTPGMSNMFGSQLINAVGQGGSFGQGMVNSGYQASQMPGKFDTATDRISQISGAAAPWVDYFGGGKQQQNPWGGGNGYNGNYNYQNPNPGIRTSVNQGGAVANDPNANYNYWE